MSYSIVTASGAPVLDLGLSCCPPQCYHSAAGLLIKLACCSVGRVDSLPSAILVAAQLLFDATEEDQEKLLGPVLTAILPWSMLHHQSIRSAENSPALKPLHILYTLNLINIRISCRHILSSLAFPDSDDAARGCIVDFAQRKATNHADAPLHSPGVCAGPTVRSSCKPSCKSSRRLWTRGRVKS